MIRNDETGRTSLTPTNTNQYTGRCHICVKIALNSTLKQISDSWGHFGLSDQAPKKEQLFNGNFGSNRVQPIHLKQDRTKGKDKNVKDMF